MDFLIKKLQFLLSLNFLQIQIPSDQLDSNYYFSKIFKEKTKLTPRAYRKRYTEI
ncbi:hypothetical protein SAMN05443550_109142 [Pedobacter hartonius]|uniref:HTH araC/xylS-type domain-containing protein n=1 Tax=Pedobacter hartonius TaxID=425514 RepID=A0A1H4GB19_9SPHI|nr:hypothetical protein SAMN05443550_109142 [Pedobacter hartonius]